MHIKRGKSLDHVCSVCDRILLLTKVVFHSQDQCYEWANDHGHCPHLLPYSTASQSHKTAKIASIMPQTHLVVEVLTSGEVLGCPDEVLVATADPFPVAIPSVSITDFAATCCARGILADLKIRHGFVIDTKSMILPQISTLLGNKCTNTYQKPPPPSPSGRFGAYSL